MKSFLKEAIFDFGSDWKRTMTKSAKGKRFWRIVRMSFLIAYTFVCAMFGTLFIAFGFTGPGVIVLIDMLTGLFLIRAALWTFSATEYNIETERIYNGY